MQNARIADAFDELAELLEFRGENPFKIRAYRNGARSIRGMEEAVTEILADPARKLHDLPGIGKAIAEKSATLVDSGDLPELVALRDEIPRVVLAIARIPGLGAKKAVTLHQELALETLEDLSQACHDGRVAQLKGFSAKTQQTILAGLAIAQQAATRIFWSEADVLATRIADHMRACPDVRSLEWAGSYRRKCETIGDLDLVVVAEDRDRAIDHLEAFPDRTATILRGDTKVSIRVGHAFQVDMRLVEQAEFGAALQYFTGSQAHNVRVRQRAKKRGLKINEYGVFRVADGSNVAAQSEADVYAAVGLAWIPPELREDRHEFDSVGGERPPLLELSDIRGDLHMHTTATDGKANLRTMAEAALSRGLEYIAITDHSRRVSMANGLNPERLRQQWQEIDELRGEFAGRLEILKGIECDILEQGGMDLPDDCLAEADWVLASIHYGQRQQRQQITDRILGAIENPHVDCIAHPTGRKLNQRDPYAVDLEAVFAAAKAHGTCLELNANPARLDLNDVQLSAAKRHGIPIAINSDAHSVRGLDVMRFGINQARRAGLTANDVLNTCRLANGRFEA